MESFTKELRLVLRRLAQPIVQFGHDSYAAGRNRRQQRHFQHY